MRTMKIIRNLGVTYPHSWIRLLSCDNLIASLERANSPTLPRVPIPSLISLLVAPESFLTKVSLFLLNSHHHGASYNGVASHCETCWVQFSKISYLYVVLCGQYCCIPVLDMYFFKLNRKVYGIIFHASLHLPQDDTMSFYTLDII